jgi:hypothetical protein
VELAWLLVHLFGQLGGGGEEPLHSLEAGGGVKMDGYIQAGENRERINWDHASQKLC